VLEKLFFPLARLMVLEKVLIYLPECLLLIA
jgi:hypothetical protein